MTLTTEELIYEAVLRVEDKQDDYAKCMNKSNVVQENHKGRLIHLEKDSDEFKSVLDEHINSRSVHYDDNFSETVWERAKRKKLEITAGGFVGTILTTVLITVAEKVGWM